MIPDTKKRPQGNLNIGFIATNHKDSMQIRVLDFIHQVELFKGIKTIRNEENYLSFKITPELIVFFTRLVVD